MNDYQGYDAEPPHRSALDVAIAFLAKWGRQPAVIEWQKPGMWLAGPVEKNAPASCLTAEAGAPAQLAVGVRAPDVSIPASGQEGNGEWTQPNLI